MGFSAGWRCYQKNLSQVRNRLLFAVLALIFSLTLLHADDYWPKDEWRTATPESQGMSSEMLSDMMDTLWQKNLAIDSILIVRNGHVVLDTYQFPLVPDRKHNLYSCTKSITSTLIGIAIDKGYIKSVDQRLLGFFPEKKPENPDLRKRQITLKNVLQMATGLECRDSYLYRWKGLGEMHRSEDWVQYMINLPMVEAPGTRFEYCNGASFLLSAIIEKTTGRTGLEFAIDHLFKPIGIQDIHWRANIHGQTIGWGDLHMRPRDMAKFGYLFLKNGEWNGQQVVPADWVAESTRKHISTTSNTGYGYQWWIMSPGNYVAVGFRGQRIFVLKDQQMIVVFTSRLQERDTFVPAGILGAYIIPAIKSNSPLPTNTKALNRLTSLDQFWQTADYVDRDKRRKKLAIEDSGPKRKRYVNKQFRFSVEYDAEFVVSPPTLKFPFVFAKTGLRRLRGVYVVVDDIPLELKLKQSEEHIIRFMQGIKPFSNIKLIHKELIHLSDGKTANYFELEAKYLVSNIVLTGVIGYKNQKLIGVAAIGALGTPIEYLKGMVRSLKLETANP